MSAQAIEQALDELKKFIQDRHPGVKMEFSRAIFGDHAELWVYVMELDKFQTVEALCQQLTKDHEDKTYPFWVFAKAWSGPWPGGESLQEIKRRRKVFLEKIKKQSTAPSGRGEPVS